MIRDLISNLSEGENFYFYFISQEDPTSILNEAKEYTWITQISLSLSNSFVKLQNVPILPPRGN